jgi:hypothetical protein
MQHWLLDASWRDRPPASCVAALGPRQCEHLAAVVAELGMTWSVELHDEAPGDATIIIVWADVLRAVRIRLLGMIPVSPTLH